MRLPRPSPLFAVATRPHAVSAAISAPVTALLVTLLALAVPAPVPADDGTRTPRTGEEQGDQDAGASQGARLRVTSTESSGQKVSVEAEAGGQKIRIVAEEGDRESDEEPGPGLEGEEVQADKKRRERGDVEIDIRAGRPHVRNDGNDRVALGHDIRVSAGDVVVGNVVCILGSARIDGTVRGDVVVIGGNIEVGSAGLVRGEAIAIGGGSVEVGPGGIVEGEAVAVGGRVDQADSALVGERVEISFVPSFGPRFGLSGLLWLGFILHLIVVGMIGWLLLGLNRRRSAIATATLRARGWESLLAGVGAAIIYHIFAVPLLLLLAVVFVAIVIGIPLVPVIALLILIFPIPGYLVTATLLGLSATGQQARANLGSPLAGEATPGEGSAAGPIPQPEGLTRAYLLGHLFLSVPGVLSLLLALLTGGPGLASKSFLLLEFAVIHLAIALGWGAFLLSRFGRRAPAVAA